MSNVERVKLLIGDQTNLLFTDAEIQEFLTMSAVGGVENVFAAASVACQSLATSGVLLSKIEKIGNYSISRATLTEKYSKLAKDYKALVDEAPAVGVLEQSWTNANAVRILINDAMRGM